MKVLDEYYFFYIIWKEILKKVLRQYIIISEKPADKINFTLA